MSTTQTPGPTAPTGTDGSAAPDSAGGAAQLRLPGPDGTLVRHLLRAPGVWRRPTAPLRSRVAYAAAHVVADPAGETIPGAPAVLDWDRTLAFRHDLWSWGFGVADAMDTAQRGMGLDWAATQELIRRSGAEAASVGGALVCGAGTDQLDLDEVRALAPAAARAAVLAAYREQLEVVLDAGATPVLMASRALAATATSAADYEAVYGTLLGELTQPVVLHWLGTAFDPALQGYWGSDDVETATATFLGILGAHADVVDGVKVSLLDAEHEVRLRRAMPAGVRLYTGDDFHYPELMRGDEHGYSDALLGILAGIAPAASTALQAWDDALDGDPDGWERGSAILTSTQALGRHIFRAPTSAYKTGIVLLSWLNGHQPSPAMVGGLASARSLSHHIELFRLADAAGLLLDPGLAAHRMGLLLRTHGVLS